MARCAQLHYPESPGEASAGRAPLRVPWQRAGRRCLRESASCALTTCLKIRPAPQCGLATLILTAAAPLGGVISFRKMGIIDRFPETMHGGLKWAHRKVLPVPCALCPCPAVACAKVRRILSHESGACMHDSIGAS